MAEDALTKQVAALAAVGTKQTEIAKQLGISVRGVSRILNTEDCKKQMMIIGQEAVSTAKETVRKRTAQMTEKFLAALEKNLEEGNHQVFTHYLKIIGFADTETEKADTQIVVQLPSMPAEPKNVTKEAEYDEVKIDG